MLILFDIDGTLLNTHGLGMRVIAQAGSIEFDRPFTTEGVEFAGRLDPLIFADTLSINSIDPTPDHLNRLRTAYVNLFTRITDTAESPLGSACPGVFELLDALERKPSTSVGVLTGNIRETGTRKLAHCGLDPARFHINVWGDEAQPPSENTPPDRAHLPPRGIARYEQRTGQTISPGRVLIIGDTPHDIRCAKHNNMRSLGVATGHFTADDLQAAGADLAVATLQDTDAILQWIFSNTE